MLDFSFLDVRLLFPHITEAWALAFESSVNLLNIISIILIVVGEWQLFKKFGEKPWKSLIMYYNSYILYKHTWSKKAFWIYLISSSAFDIAQAAAKRLSQTDPTNVWMTMLVLISLPFGIVAAICSILYAFRFAEAFGKGKRYAFGLLLIYPVFIAIVGIGKVQYIGNRNADRVNSGTAASETNGEVL